MAEISPLSIHIANATTKTPTQRNIGISIFFTTIALAIIAVAVLLFAAE